MASNALLAEIQVGKKLKKTETNDRSAPVIENASKTPYAATSSAAPTVTATATGGPPQLAGLLAGGIPKLKPVGQNSLGEQDHVDTTERDVHFAIVDSKTS